MTAPRCLIASHRLLLLSLILTSGGLPLAAIAGEMPPLQRRAGEPIRGLSPQELSLFWEGRALYATPVSAAEGLGPIFNKSNCQSCHSVPVGGWGSISVTHFGFEKKGSFDELLHLGGPLLQELSLAPGCAELVPAEANVVVQRVTNSSMAFGLIEAIPDEAIAANEDPFDLDGDGVSGRVHWVPALEDPAGSPLRAGRFGWKAQVATVLTFSGDAARNEMGLTNRLFPTENAPNGDASRLIACDPLPDPEDHPDDAGFDFIDRVTHFQRYLGPPPQTPRSGMTGEAIFTTIGCAKCHMPEWTTSNDPALEEALRGKVIRPYSDFLIHNMGLLGDGIRQGDAGELEMRTPVLWNLRTRDPMLHDGSAAGGTFADRIAAAVAAHGPFGEGAGSAAAFAALSPGEKAQVVAFLDSLGRLEFDLDGDGAVDLMDLGPMRDCFGGGPYSPDDPCAVADLDQDGAVGLLDLGRFVEAYQGENGDCDGDGLTDIEEIVRGLAPDEDGDGVPDDCGACPADLDGNGLVGGGDLAILLTNWGAKGSPADIDGDGVVNGADLASLLTNWGACP